MNLRVTFPTYTWVRCKRATKTMHSLPVGPDSEGHSRAESGSANWRYGYSHPTAFCALVRYRQANMEKIVQI